MNKFLIVHFTYFVLLSGCAFTQQIDVVLHDGRQIKVERTSQKKFEAKIFERILGLPINPSFKYGLKFKNPDTQETISWQGINNFEPVLLDFVNSVPYLVVMGFITKDTEIIYGCPVLVPYFYLKYESGFFGKWLPVPVEKAPKVLHLSNLLQDNGNDAGYFQPVIPRTFDEWNYIYKDNFLKYRTDWTCISPRE